jgi:hypothetical protein
MGTIPNSVNELVQFIVAFVGDRADQTQRPVQGTAIAQAIRTRYPGMSYHQLGVERLADVIRIGEREGLLQRRRDVSHLEVVPGVGSAPNVPVLSSPEPELRYVRPDVWKSIIFFQSRSTHFFDRVTARVVECDLTDADRLKQFEDGTRYVKLEMIPASAQREWMKEYLKTASVADAESAPIESSRWWLDFPKWLQDRNPELEAGWRVYRIQSIISYVRSWAQQNNVPVTAVLSDRPSYSDYSRKVPGASTRPCPASNKIESSDQRIKDALVKAISELSLEELANLSLPVRCILRHFVVR